MEDIFKDKVVQMGNMILNKKLTVGDYQINHFGALFTFDSGTLDRNSFVMT